jgi:hypothetical protein
MERIGRDTRVDLNGINMSFEEEGSPGAAHLHDKQPTAIVRQWRGKLFERAMAGLKERGK